MDIGFVNLHATAGGIAPLHATLRSKRFPHENTYPEAGWLSSDVEKTARLVKFERVRIADDMYRTGVPHAAIIATPINQRAAYAAAPEERFYEQTVKLRIAVIAIEHRRKADYDLITSSHKHLPGQNLLGWEFNYVDVREQRFSVAGIPERSAQLQPLQTAAL